jgi:hypothetical protein
MGSCRDDLWYERSLRTHVLTLYIVQTEALQDGALLNDRTQAVGSELEPRGSESQVAQTPEGAKGTDRLAQPSVEEVSRQCQAVETRLRSKVELRQDLQVRPKRTGLSDSQTTFHTMAPEGGDSHLHR